MKKITPKDVKLFCDHCKYLLAVFNHFDYLYGINDENDEKNLQIMRNSAPTFFADLRRILVCAIVVETYKITDKASFNRKGETIENLTVNLIHQKTDFSHDPAKQELVNKLVDSINAFGAQIKASRNLDVAHYDRETQLRGEPIHAFTRGEFSYFIENLQAFSDIVHQYYIGKPYNIYEPVNTSELINLLEKGILSK